MQPWLLELSCVAACAACGRVSFDARSDAVDGSAEDGPAALFCDRPHTPPPTVCADFDHGLPMAAGFTTMQLGGVGQLGLVDGVNDSPTSLGAQLDMQTDSMTISTAALLYQPAGQPSRVTYTADVFVVDPPGADYETSEVLVITPGGHFDWDVNLGAGGVTTFLEEFYVPTPLQFSAMNTPLAPLARSAWHTITVQVDIANMTRELVVDGVTVVSGPTKFAFTPGALTVYVGIAWSMGVTPPVGIYVDNVLITVE